MSQKVILIADPGIDGAFAVALALFDPELEVLGIAATAGNVPAEQATFNVQILIEQFDPQGAGPGSARRPCRIRNRRHPPARRQRPWRRPISLRSCIIRTPATSCWSIWFVNIPRK